MKTWLRRTFLGCGFAVMIFILGFVGLMIAFRLATPNHFDDRSFDQQVWASFSKFGGPDNPRGQMFDDLLKRHLSRHMTKADVIALLGAPDLAQKDSRFSYNLGMWSGMRMDPDSLEIEFDESGRFKRAYRVQH